MLAYLDQLCTALLARDARATARLLRHPLAAALPAPVRDEAEAVEAAGAAWRGTPLAALRCYHQTGQLLRTPGLPGAGPTAAPRGRRRAPRERAGQIELPLSAA